MFILKFYFQNNGLTIDKKFLTNKAGRLLVLETRQIFYYNILLNKNIWFYFDNYLNI